MSVFLYSITIRVTGAILALSLNVIMARLLGVDQYGRYMTLLSMALVLGGLSVRGVNYVLIREIAGDAGQVSALRKKLVKWACSRVGKGTCLAAFIFLIWSVLIYFGRTSVRFPVEVYSSIIASIAIVLFSAFLALEASVINGYSASLKCQGLNLVVKNTASLLLLGILYLIANHSVNYSQILWIQAGSYVLSLLVGMYWLRQLIREKGIFENGPSAEKTQNQNNIRIWSTASRHFFLVTISVILINRLDVVFVSTLASSKVVGIYAAGARLAQVALMIALAVIVVLSPRIAKAHKAGEHLVVSKLVRSGFKFTIPIALTEIVVAWLLGPQIVGLFGKSYASSTGPFIWVVIAYAFWTAAAPAYALLSMTEKEKILAIINWLILILNVIAIYFLTPVFGATGAGAAMSVGYVVAALIIFSTQVSPSHHRAQ